MYPTYLEWWDSLSSAQKTQICDTNTELLGGIRRWENLTVNQIMSLFKILKDEAHRNIKIVYNR